MGERTKVDVYFDYKEEGSWLIIGVIMVEDFEVILKEKREIKKDEGTNFYNWTLESFKYAMELLREEDIDEVELKNQQRLVFDWMLNENYKEQYEEQYKYILDNLRLLVERGTSITYEVIKGKDNRVKKYLKTQKKKLGREKVGGDLTGLFKKEEKTNIIDFKKLRKNA